MENIDTADDNSKMMTKNMMMIFIIKMINVISLFRHNNDDDSFNG